MIKDNIEKIKRRIGLACIKSGRKPEEITLVAVTKNRSVEQIEEVICCGIIDIGENKVQETLLKFNKQSGIMAKNIVGNGFKPFPTIHMVGHLQTNKAKDVVRIFDLIHSVDSLHLTEEINKQAAKINKIQNVLLEIKTSPEATKFGILPEEAREIFEKAAQFHNIKVRGLMTIAPLVRDPQEARPYFRVLRELRDKLSRERFKTVPYIATLPILSMGMTDDFEVAIEEGATMVRIGRAIFDE